MTSGEELLAAVIADPDDVDRRLVYADWLVAQGDPQGELIQLCERWRSHPDPSLDARIRELHATHRERIAGEVAQLAVDYVLERGFVTLIMMSAPTFARHGERLVASHPIAKLGLRPVTAKSLARLARAPALSRLRILNVSPSIGRSRVRPQPMSFDELLASPYFESLRRFEVDVWETEGDPHEAFARWQAPQLESLCLWGVDSAPRILTGLARNESVRLRELEVNSYERASPSWMPALAASAFERLETLRLGTRGPSVLKLFDGASLPRLTTLALGPNVPLDRLCFPSLRRLSGGRATARDLARLLERHPRLEALRIDTMKAKHVNRSLELVLALPSEHPLACLQLPQDKGVDRALLDRVSERFSRDWQGQY